MMLYNYFFLRFLHYKSYKYSMKVTTTLYFFIFSLITISCGSVNNNDRTTKLNLIASEKLEGKVELMYNSDSTKVICIGGKTNLSQSYSFFVYSIKSSQSITKTFNNISNVMWDGNHAIKYKYLSGIVQAGENNSKFTIINFKD